MFRQRLILGLLFGAALLAIFYLDQVTAVGWPGRTWSFPPGTLFAILMAGIVPFAISEMHHLLAKEKIVLSKRVCVTAAMLCLLWPWMEQLSELLLEHPQGAHPLAIQIAKWIHSVMPEYLISSVLGLAFVGALLMYSRHQKIEGAMASAGGSLLTIIYLGVLPGFFLPIRLSHSSGMIVSIFLMVKGADVGAYAFGKKFGKHKLIPWLSPRKTWEGFFGGLFLAAIIGTLLAHFTQGYFWWQGLAAGIILGAVGQVGDLLESLLKRDAGVKDSGAVPGFGGVLDMIDSPLLAAPAAYWLLKLVH
ncbi:MAG TPA: phosphatidate cytidylyltransferase [Phycisphaerae bacterium]|nr:phosphatidate cytidylyltransferase [Phycisphaerae bacterium]